MNKKKMCVLRTKELYP